MKSIGILASVALCMAFLMTGSAISMQHEATAEKGKALFNDPKLGKNGKSCNDCHKDGAGLEKAGEKKDLDKIVNGCIKGNLKGKALKAKSVEMQSMILYLKSFGMEKSPAGRKAPVGC